MHFTLLFFLDFKVIVHPDGDIYVCLKCKKTYKQKKSFIEHINHECGRPKLYPCSFCGFTFTKLISLNNHIKHKHHVQISKYILKGRAGASIKIVRCLLLEDECEDVKAHVCTACNKSYRHLKGLRNHTKYECNKEPQFVCNFCNHAFFQKGNLKTHIIKMHGDEGLLYIYNNLSNNNQHWKCKLVVSCFCFLVFIKIIILSSNYI